MGKGARGCYMDGITKILKNRYFIIALIMLLIMIIFLGKLYKLQIIDGKLYISQSAVRIERRYKIHASRGNIYDRNGVLLAYNRECQNVYLTKAFTASENLNPTLLNLYDLLTQNNEKFLKSLTSVLEYNQEYETFVFNKDWTSQDLLAWQTRQDLFARAETAVQYDANDFFRYLRKYFYVDNTYSDLDAYKIVTLRYEILKMRPDYMSGYIEIASDVSLETVAYITENSHKLGGVSLRKSYVRAYTDEAALAAHIVGYVGLVSDKEMEDDVTLTSDYMIGKMGIEQYCEDYLRGEDGYAVVETDVSGKVLSVIEGKKPVNGNDVYLTIDIELQRASLDALAVTIEEIIAKADGTKNFGDANAAVAIVIDVDTGELLACANNKSFDPSWFIDSDEESVVKRLEAINDEANTPMFNRAIQALYTPGSIFKPIVAIAGLESKAINNDTLIECKMKTDIGGHNFTCLSWHGKINVTKAIEQSCNIFFNLLGVETGIDSIDAWARAFGLGVKTGIDLPNESRGIISNKEYKMQTFSESWWIADTAQSAIGQLYNNFTPVQIASYTATLASSGRKYTPHVILRIEDENGDILYEGDKSYTEIGISEETDVTIREAMKLVAKEGTASRVFSKYPLVVAAKTGTAETGYEIDSSSNGLSIAYAPADSPEIAACVVIEKGVWGSYTVPALMRIFNEYFDIELEEEIVDDTLVTNEQ